MGSVRPVLPAGRAYASWPAPPPNEDEKKSWPLPETAESQGEIERLKSPVERRKDDETKRRKMRICFSS